MKPKELKSTVNAVAKAFLNGPERRLDRWIWDQRSEQSIVDRATMPVVMGVLDKLQSLGVTLASIGEKGTSMPALIRRAQTVICRRAYNAHEKARGEITPSRDGRLVFTADDLAEIDPLMFTPEVSRHDDHKLVPDQLEAAEYAGSIPFRYNEWMYEQLTKFDKSRKDAKPLFTDRFRNEMNRVATQSWTSPCSIFSQIARMHAASKGAGTYQNGKWERSLVEGEDQVSCNDVNLKFFQKQLEDNYGITESKWADIMAAPQAFLGTFAHGKETGIVLRYCRAVQEIKETGKTACLAGYDMPASLLMLIYLILGLPLEEVEKIAFCNSPKFVHARKRLLQRVRNKLVHLQDINQSDLDGDIVKPCFTKGGYGAAAKAVGLAMLGLSVDGEEEEDDDSPRSILDNFLNVSGQQDPVPPDCIAHLFVDKSREQVISLTIALCEFVIKEMMKMYPALSKYVETCRLLWTNSVEKTGAPPKVVAANGYEFHPRLWRRDLNSWWKCELNSGVGKYLVPKDIHLNNFVPAEGGTPMPPNLTHLTEGCGMTKTILVAKGINLPIATNMDWYAVPVGRSLELFPCINEGVNFATRTCILTQLDSRIKRDGATEIPLNGPQLARL